MTVSAMNNEQQGGPGVWGAITGFLGRFGFSPPGLVLLVIVALLPLFPPFDQEHMIRWLIMGAFLAAQAVAFDFTAGYINVVNFGFAAILGAGAYTSAIMANKSPVLLLQPGLSPWLGMFIGAAVAGLIGLGLGYLTLRLRGIFAAVMAWFVGIALMGVVQNLTELTRGPLGMNARGLLETPENLPYYYVILAMMLVIYIALRLVTNSHIGLAFKAIGQNLDAAKASGINPTKYRVLNFTLSCIFAGWLGGFYAHYFRSLTPQTLMHTSKTVEVLALAYIGGRGSMWGGMFIAFPFVFAIEYIRSTLTDLPGIHLVIYGVLMIVVMIFYPEGLAGLYKWLVEKIRSARSKA